MTVNQRVSGSSPEGGAKRRFLEISKIVKIVQTHASTRFRGFSVSSIACYLDRLLLFTVALRGVVFSSVNLFH